jgi:hypothetical protein
VSSLVKEEASLSGNASLIISITSCILLISVPL